MGILKTLGFRPRQILALLMGEALALSLAGWALGCAGGKLAYALVPRTLIHQFELMMIWGLGGVIVAAAGYFLLWRAAQVMQDSCPQQGSLAKPCAGERVETRGRER